MAAKKTRSTRASGARKTTARGTGRKAAKKAARKTAKPARRGKVAKKAAGKTAKRARTGTKTPTARVAGSRATGAAPSKAGPSVRFLAVCDRRDFTGPPRATEEEALDDCVAHQEAPGKDGHRVTVVVQQAG